jgi:hypothetical protein
MRHEFTWLIVIGSLALASCDRPHAEARRRLASSTSLRYVGCGFYLDGGSMGFMFTNQAAQHFLVFVQNPWHGEGVIEKDGRKIQRVLIASTKEFALEEALELPVHSRAEAKVTQLVHSALQESLPDEQRAEILCLLDIVTERTFDWETWENTPNHSFQRMRANAPPR